VCAIESPAIPTPTHDQVIFIVEAALKIAGLGATEYFEDNWNRMDFIIVLESILSGILVLKTQRYLLSSFSTSHVTCVRNLQVLVLKSSGSTVNTSTLRLLRLLRPLRTLSFIPVRTLCVHNFLAFLMYIHPEPTSVRVFMLRSPFLFRRA
jgi:hypothetical protein